MDISITLSGNLGADPRLREVGQDRIPCTEFSLAHTPRVLDRATGQWEDGQTRWFRVTCWRRLAQNAALSLRRGDTAIVSGRLRLSEWVDEQGVVHTRDEIEAIAVGTDLGRHTVQVIRRARSTDPARADTAQQNEEAADTEEAAVPDEGAPAGDGTQPAEVLDDAGVPVTDGWEPDGADYAPAGQMKVA